MLLVMSDTYPAVIRRILRSLRLVRMKAETNNDERWTDDSGYRYKDTDRPHLAIP